MDTYNSFFISLFLTFIGKRKSAFLMDDDFQNYLKKVFGIQVVVTGKSQHAISCRDIFRIVLDKTCIFSYLSWVYITLKSNSIIVQYYIAFILMFTMDYLFYVIMWQYFSCDTSIIISDFLLFVSSHAYK